MKRVPKIWLNTKKKIPKHFYMIAEALLQVLNTNGGNGHICRI